MANELWHRFDRELRRHAEARAPEGARAAMERYSWTSRDVARQFGVSERTARRWRQQDRIPARRAEAWREGVRSEAQARTRARAGRRGLRRLQVTGQYLVDGNPKYRYKATPGAPVKLMPGNKISGATMREVFAAADRGDVDEAEQLLGDALAEGYEMSGGAGLQWESVDDLDFGID